MSTGTFTRSYSTQAEVIRMAARSKLLFMCRTSGLITLKFKLSIHGVTRFPRIPSRELVYFTLICLRMNWSFVYRHTFGERFTKQKWHKEIAGQREILHLYGGVNRADIRGMRAPFLQAGGNKQFEMLHEDNFTYDSSMPVFENSPPFWPYTLDYSINHECMIAPCPTKSFPGDYTPHKNIFESKTYHICHCRSLGNRLGDVARSAGWSVLDGRCVF